MEKQQTKKMIVSTIMMYFLSITKLIVPLISLPYLTRVLSVECYGSVSFVKSLMSYMQIFVDFGFLYSGTRDIVKLIKDKQSVDKEVGNITYAQLLLWLLAFVIVSICCLFMDILKGFQLYTLLSMISVLLSIFLFEYVFRAIEQMGVITLRFVIVKVLSLILTIIFIKSDSDVILIPIFDIISSLIAIIPVVFELKKLGVKCKFSFKNIKQAFACLKKSLVFFISNFSALAFTSLNTLVIGFVLTKTEVAQWSVAMQLVTAITVLYNPIITSVYPTMLKEKSLKIIHKLMMIYIPLILVGCVFVWLWAEDVVTFVLTDNYIMSAKLLKNLIPVLIVLFPSMLYSWPCFGAIEKDKVNAYITLVSAMVQILGIIVLIMCNIFSLVNLVIVKIISEFVLCLLRVILVYKNKKLFYSTKINNQETKEG